MDLFKGRFSAANLEQWMCRDLIGVDRQGDPFDCTSNKQLGLPMRGRGRHAARVHLRDRLARDFNGTPIRVADHRQGCTAGRGSSCGWAQAEDIRARAA
jgi:hypothetical protein